MKTRNPSDVRTLKNQWGREDHYARCLPALGQIIDITPARFQSSRSEEVRPMMPPPERLVNRRVTREQLELHHAFQSSRSEEVKPKAQRAVLVVKHGRIERVALAAANEALEPLHRTWWARLSRAVRSLVGGRG